MCDSWHDETKCIEICITCASAVTKPLASNHQFDGNSSHSRINVLLSTLTLFTYCVSLLLIMLSIYCNRVPWFWDVWLQIISLSLYIWINIINQINITMSMNLNFICLMKKKKKNLRSCICKSTSKMNVKNKKKKKPAACACIFRNITLTWMVVVLVSRDVIPSKYVQMRNVVLSRSPHNMRLPEPDPDPLLRT